MKILVTGAGGMVGRNLLADPRAGRHQILSPSRNELDLADSVACDAFLVREKPDLVIHLAAVVGGVQAHVDAPAPFLADNLAIALNLLGAARRADIPRLINLGSSCMYPSDREGELSEDQLLTGPLEPTNEGYAIAKLAAWKLTQAFGREAPGRLWRTLIPPNLYGLHDRFDPARSHLVAAAITKIDRALRAGVREVEIWGDGAARREFMFAGDLADFIWRFHDRLGDLPETLNVGVGEDATVDDYYRVVAAVMGYSGAFRHDLSRPVGMRRKLLDVGGQTRLGWRPATPLIEGMAATVTAYRHGFTKHS
ncbi:MAG TPA: NAD-dependent epimerase/dehydratase family protein [Caulobacteraceae bacterium]|nr:NAD-dependent epimerase/dehydratase family protein [Caulobacteraceae bacterium]